MTHEIKSEDDRLIDINFHLLRIQLGKRTKRRGNRGNGSKHQRGTPVGDGLSSILKDQAAMWNRKIKKDSSE